LGFDFKLYKIGFLLNLSIGLIIAFSYGVIIIGGINLVFQKEITTGVLIVFIFYLDNLTSPLLQIIDSVTLFREMKIKINRLHDVFATKNYLQNNGLENLIEDFTITFKNIIVKDANDETILNDVSCIIPSGKLTVLVGTSGSGKTTLTSLIPRLANDPFSGDIFIGDKNILDYSLETLRENITFVPQENLLFNDTIKNIITYGNPEASETDIQNAVELACCTDIVHKHKQGFHFKIGEGGTFLSGGQRQRLMIARAFLKNAKIVIMDEPLSSLDIKTRTEIWKNIRKFTHKKTTIIVTNILDVIHSADNIIVMNNGKIEYCGNPHDLLNDSELYKLIMSEV